MSEIKERPILFSGPMVRAILEGRKTVTRRPVKGLQIPKEDLEQGETRLRWSAVGQRDRRYGFCVFGETEEECAMELGDFGACPYGRQGDRLWVRESTEADYETHDAVTLARYCADKAPVLITGCEDPAFNGSVAHWNYPRDVRPSIHMPRWVSRILLEVTAVRVERLQDISEEQAEAEGVDFLRHAPDADETLTAKQLFECLWCGINGDASWNANPWVWVVEFKRVTP